MIPFRTPILRPMKTLVTQVQVSDYNDSQIWNPPRFSRRLSTFSDSDIPPLPEIEWLRSSRTAPVDLELQPPNVTSISGTTDAQISEQEWIGRKTFQHKMGNAML